MILKIIMNIWRHDTGTDTDRDMDMVTDKNMVGDMDTNMDTGHGHGNFAHVNDITVADRKRPGVSGPIRSVKMYSCVQCTMQKGSVYCRDAPCLAHMKQGPGPLHPEHLPPSLSAWVIGTQSTSSLQQGWTWTVEWTLVSSPTTNLWSRKMYVDIVFISI
jgi:hypothetical protein